MCGMAAAMMLADDGHEVTVLERDAAPPPPDPDSAFDWDRRSVAQFGLAHILLARGSNIMKHQLPSAYRLLGDHGGYGFNLVEFLLGLQGAESTPDDERFDVLTGRRSTLEWALATAAGDHPGVTLRRGDAIAGLTTGTSVLDGVPHVTGLRLQTGEEVLGEIVIDATGRRSATPDWLAEIGAVPPGDHAEDSGFAYYGRYFRSADGSTPPMMGPLLAPYGTFSVLTLPADNGTWSVTLYGLSDDKQLRRFRDADVHERVVRSCPLQAHWLDGEPISDMASMAGVVDRHRRFVVDGKPCATGLLSVGDASSCTNPSLGRGITLGFIHVELLRREIARHGDDPVALALAFDEATENEMRPFHDATTALDRRRVAEMRAELAGEQIEPDPDGELIDLLAGSAALDPACTRAFAEVFNLYVLPGEVLARPGMQELVQSLAGKVSTDPLPGPTRGELMALLA
jgi:2-polyprenyl-6-methoxyphenol hydroxylase-like FAD-dependent oxidoreductase